MTTLQVQDLGFRYEPAAPEIITSLNLCLEPGDTALIIGDNGCGKTTFGKMLAGVLQPQRGAVLIDSRPVHKVPIPERPRHAMYLGQTSYLQFFRSSIAEEITWACSLSRRDPKTLSEAYQAFSLPADQNAKPMDLAYPEMWRFQLLLMAVIFSPSVLFVDEVVAPGSPLQREALNYLLRQRNAAGQITLVAYQRDLDWFSHQTFTLEAGRLQQQPTNDRA